MSVKSNQAITVLFTTANASTGAATDATGDPAGTLYVNGTADAASVTVTKITTGVYKAAVTLPALSAGDQVSLRIAATVATVAGEGVIWQETADTYRTSDIETLVDDLETNLATTDGKADQLVAAVITNAAGTDIAADIIALKTVADTIQADTDLLDDAAGGIADIHTDLGTLTTTVGAAGAGLTAVPWNATWDAQAQSECADAITAAGLATDVNLNNWMALMATAAELAKVPKSDGVVSWNATALAAIRTAIGLAGANLDAQLGDIPNNAEFAAALAAADDAVLAAIAALHDYDGSDTAGTTTLLARLSALWAAQLDAAVSTRLATTDYTAPDNAGIADIPTNTEFANALAALHDLDATEVQAAASAALEAIFTAALQARLANAATVEAVGDIVAAASLA